MRCVFVFTISLLLFVGCKSRCSDASSTKIVGGDFILNADDPVLKSTLKMINPEGGLCTATLIGPNHVVTAAHCVYPSLSPRTTLSYGSYGEIFVAKIVGFKVHEAYSKDQLQNDIAIIVFKEKLPLSLRPVAITSNAKVAVGDPIVVAGYGSTGEEVKDGGTLRKAGTRAMIVDRNNRRIIQIVGERKGTCYGDSGGPVYVQESSGLSLTGITSTGINCDVGDGIYTDVRHYQGWMKCNFAALGYPLESLARDASLGECQGNALKFRGDFDPSDPSNKLPQGGSGLLYSPVQNYNSKCG